MSNRERSRSGRERKKLREREREIYTKEKELICLCGQVNFLMFFILKMSCWAVNYKGVDQIYCDTSVCVFDTEGNSVWGDCQLIAARPEEWALRLLFGIFVAFALGAFFMVVSFLEVKPVVFEEGRE